MPFKRTLAASLTVIGLMTPACAQALELGIQDHDAPPAQLDEWAAQTGATWERILVDLGDPTAADKIRVSHAAGRKVLLTIGGIGTHTRHPSFRLALRYIDTLPRAEKYTISNEPNIDGVTACNYRRGWMIARRVLGRRLLWGDTSPHTPLSFTLAAMLCGRLPRHLDFATHPYQVDDPLAPTKANVPWTEGCLGCLSRIRRELAQRGIRVTWWLTEFGYGANLAGLRISDDRAGWLWPRAIRQAQRVDAKVLVIYTARGETWDTRPGVQAWTAIARARE